MRRLGPVEGISGGAFGEPGRRTFYLQVDAGDERHWFLMEKQQLASLAKRLLEVIGGLEAVPPSDPPELSPPTEVAFRVGELAVAVADGHFTVVLRPAESEEAEAVEFEVEQGQIHGMSRAALEVVAAGRPLCEFCNLPKDRGGHICPATNGHRGARLEA